MSGHFLYDENEKLLNISKRHGFVHIFACHLFTSRCPRRRRCNCSLILKAAVLWHLLRNFFEEPSSSYFPYSVKAFSPHWWPPLLFQKTQECEDGMTSLFQIIMSILLPRAECLEYIPLHVFCLNRTVVWVYSVYSYSEIGSIERTLN